MAGSIFCVLENQEWAVYSREGPRKSEPGYSCCCRWWSKKQGEDHQSLILLSVPIIHHTSFQLGEAIPNSVVQGDKVLVPEYGGTKVIFEDQVTLQDVFLYYRL